MSATTHKTQDKLLAALHAIDQLSKEGHCHFHNVARVLGGNPGSIRVHIYWLARGGLVGRSSEHAVYLTQAGRQVVEGKLQMQFINKKVTTREPPCFVRPDVPKFDLNKVQTLWERKDAATVITPQEIMKDLLRLCAHLIDTKGYCRTPDINDRTDMTTANVIEYLRRLRGARLLELQGIGRRSYYLLTELGLSWLDGKVEMCYRRGAIPTFPAVVALDVPKRPEPAPTVVQSPQPIAVATAPVKMSLPAVAKAPSSMVLESSIRPLTEFEKQTGRRRRVL